MKLINLKQFRKERGLTQKQFGEKMKLPQSTVSYLENGMQEVTDYLLGLIAKRFAVDNINDYVYERSTFHSLVNYPVDEQLRLETIFAGNWNESKPIEMIESFPIICKIGNICIGRDGTLVIDRNNGIGYKLSHYIIRPDQFEEPNLLLSLTTKKWFDKEMYENFKRAYYVGCKLAEIYPMKQLKEALPP